MFKKIRKTIESHRNSEKIYWKFLVLVKDFFWRLSEAIKSIFNYIHYIKEFFLVIFLNIKSLHSNKLIAYYGNAPFVFHAFETIYKKIKNKYEIYFIIPSKKREAENYKNYLIKQGIPKNKIIHSNYGKLINWKIFISSWIVEELPLKIFKTKKIQMYHGAGTSVFQENLKIKSNYRILENLKKFDYHFMVGPQYEKALEKYCDSDHRFPVGYPKLDKLSNKKFNFKKILKKISFKNKNLPIIVYSPHHIKYFSLNKFGLKLIKLMLKMKINLIVKLHDHIKRVYGYKKFNSKLLKMEKKYPNLHIAKEPDSTLYYPIADVVITDVATSAGFEAIICDKPVIIFNSKKWFKIHGKLNYIEKKLEKAVYVINSPKELPRMIKYALKNKKEKSPQRKKVVKEVYYNLGTATKEAIKVIDKLMKN